MRAMAIPVAGAVLAGSEAGRGRPLIVLHGGPDFDDEYLREDVGRLAGLGRVISYAQRGRGRSFAGEGPDDVSIDGEVADLDAVRDWTGSPQVVLIGHSFGTVIALEYVSRFPDRVSHLVLMNPAPASHDDALMLRSHLARLRSPEQEARMAVLGTDPAYLAGDAAVDLQRYAIHFAPAVHNPASLDVILGRLRRTFSAEAIVAARAIEDRLYEQTWLQPSYDLLSRLAGLRVPALVIRGEYDFVPRACARRIVDALVSARFVELTDCGHFAHLEQPDAVYAAVADLLR